MPSPNPTAILDTFEQAARDVLTLRVRVSAGGIRLRAARAAAWFLLGTIAGQPGMPGGDDGPEEPVRQRGRSRGHQDDGRGG